MYHKIAAILLILLLSSCDSEQVDKQANAQTENQSRGLKTILIKETQETTVRRYPSVLQPASTSVLSLKYPDV